MWTLAAAKRGYNPPCDPPAQVLVVVIASAAEGDMVMTETPW